MPRSKQEAQRRKKRVLLEKDAPLPIPIPSSGGGTSAAAEWFYFTGYIQGSTVVVRHSGDMDFLYKMGFFGKGTLSRSEPNFEERRQRVNLRVPTGDHHTTQTVQCAVLSKRNYLAHRRYRALADGNGDELSDVIRFEEEQYDLVESSEESEDYTDDENAPEEEHSIGRIQAFKLLNSQNATREGSESDRISSGDVPRVDLTDQTYVSRFIKPYLVSMLAEVSVLSNEQITSFLRVPQELSELEDKFRVLRRAELNMLKQMYAVQFPGRNFKKGEIITLDEDENARTHEDIQNAADDAVVILDSDDESSDQESESASAQDQSTKTKKVMKEGIEGAEDTKRTGQKTKETDWDVNDPGDEEFWSDVKPKTGDDDDQQGVVNKASDSQEGNGKSGKDNSLSSLAAVNGKGEDTNGSACAETTDKPSLSKVETGQFKGMSEEMRDSVSQETESKEHSNLIKKDDSKFPSGLSDNVSSVPAESNGKQADLPVSNSSAMPDHKMTSDSKEDGYVEPDSSESQGELVGQEQKQAESSLLNSAQASAMVDSNAETSSLAVCTGQVSHTSDVGGDGDDKTSQSSNSLAGRTSGDEAVVGNKLESGEINSTESVHNSKHFLHSPKDDSSNDSDDVICIESKSAEPQTLHSFLSQGKKSAIAKPVVTKCVTFMSNITSQPTFVTASVGFSSWDPVVHFNFTGDPSHLPTAMSVPSVSEPVSSTGSSSDKKPVVYERVYPPIRSLLPNPNSQGAVIKQRLKGLPCLSSAYFKVTAQSSSSSSRNHRAASASFPSNLKPYNRQSGLNSSSSSSSSSSANLSKRVSSSSHLVMPSAHSSLASDESTLSRLTNYLKAFHIQQSPGLREPESAATACGSDSNTSSHPNTSAKLASLCEILVALRQLYDSSFSKDKPSDSTSEVEDVGLLDTLMLNLHVTLSQYLSFVGIPSAMELTLLKIILSTCKEAPSGDMGEKISDMKSCLSLFQLWVLRKRLDHVEERQQLLSGDDDGGADEMIVDMTDGTGRSGGRATAQLPRPGEDDGQGGAANQMTDGPSSETVGKTSHGEVEEMTDDTAAERGDELSAPAISGIKRKLDSPESGNPVSGKRTKCVESVDQVETVSALGVGEATPATTDISDRGNDMDYASGIQNHGQAAAVNKPSVEPLESSDERQPDTSGIEDKLATDSGKSGADSQQETGANLTSQGAKGDKSMGQEVTHSSHQAQSSSSSAASVDGQLSSTHSGQQSGRMSVPAAGSEENQICIDSSSDEDDDEASIQHSNRSSVPRRSSTGRCHPYSNKDELEGDLFVKANTSDDEAEETDDDGDMPRKGRGQRWRPCLKNDPWPVEEKLHLMLEEAFFLSYGLGCLRVEDDQKCPLDVSQMWQQFQRLKENFIPHYIAYHYFRSQGWVPKSGLKFGCDLILYREGPPFYHGSYSVVVTAVTDSSLMPHGSDFNLRELSWISLSGLNRITEHVAKELMMCYVLWPTSLSPTQIMSPECISKFKVKEVVVSRWVSSQERQNKTEEEEIP